MYALKNTYNAYIERGLRVRSSIRAVQAYEALRQAILQGVLPPSEWLVEDAIAARFRISRTPVHHAFLRLEGEGLLARVNGRLRVRHLTPQEIQDITVVREVLECAAVCLACTHARPEQMRRLKAVVKRERELLERAPVEAVREHNWKFHRNIWSLSDNTELIQVIESIAARVRLALALSIHYQDRLWRSHQEHREIVRALRARDVDRAVDIMRQHVRASGSNILRSLKDLSDPMARLEGMFQGRRLPTRGGRRTEISGKGVR